MRKSIMWIVAAASFALMASSCSGLLPIVGSGNLVETTRAQEIAFSSIDAAGIFDVEVVQTTKDSRVVIYTDDNLSSYVETSVINGILTVDIKPFTFLLPNPKSRITIYTPSLSNLELSGTGDITCLAFEIPATFAVELSGTGNLNLSGNCASLNVDASGTGNIDLAGTCTTLVITASGTGNVDTAALVARDVTLTLSGTGNCDVYASGTLSVNMSGLGDLRYTGKPTTLDLHRTGLGSISSY